MLANNPELSAWYMLFPQMSFKSDANLSVCHLIPTDRWKQQPKTLPGMDKA